MLKEKHFFFKKEVKSSTHEDRQLKFKSNLTSMLGKHIRVLLTSVNRFYFTKKCNKKKEKEGKFTLYRLSFK